jgi:hypothetical protein
MQPRDPTDDNEPDFDTPVWEGAKAAIIAGGRSAAEAIEILRAGWRAQHERDLEAWEDFQRQRRQEEDFDRDRERERDAVGEQPAGPGNPELFKDPTPSFLDIKPARHVLKKLEKKEFVELWYFTVEGCKETAALDVATSDEVFGMVSTNNGLVFQNIGASSTSSKVIKDEELNWEQLTVAKGRMIGCLKACGWSEQEVAQLVLFYLSLDIHPIRSQPYGRQAILRYQARVRRDWVDRLRTGHPYSIASVNEDLIKEYRDEIGNEDQAKNNVSFSFVICHSLDNANYLFFHCHLVSVGTQINILCIEPYMAPHRTAPLHRTLAPHRTAPSHRTAPHRFLHRTAPYPTRGSRHHRRDSTNSTAGRRTH